ncbi:MAG: mucoidy inhibitor MuiA family protein [Spirochaetales bacterium]|nr:mucoidy inhibitor MuiA family protein [Spirochaetales bacterium]
MNSIEGIFPIKEVTIYPNAARIRRVQPIALKKGMNEVVIKGLPEIITEESVRIEPMSVHSVKIMDIHSRYNVLEQYNENKHKTEMKKIDELISGQKKREARFRNYTDEFLLFLNKENLSGEDGEDLKKTIIVKNWEEFFLFLRKKLTKNRSEARELLFEWMRNQREIETAGKNAAAFTSYEKTKEYEIVARLEAAHEGVEELHVLYLQPGVSWYPAYTLRANITNKLISIHLFGMITQTTGEDWENVRVLLSTAIPMDNCNIPEIRSKKIKEQETEIIMTQAAAGSGMNRYDKMDNLQEAELESDIVSFDDEKKKIDKEQLFRKERAKRKATIKSKKEAPGTIKGFTAGLTSPQLETLSKQVMQTSEEIQAPGKKAVHLDELQNISDLIAGVDSKVLPPFSLGALSTYYKTLYAHLADHFNAQDEIPKTEDRHIYKFFKKGVPLESSMGGFDYRYKVAALQKKIPSSSVPLQVGVDIKDLPVELLYITIPREKEVVYLKAVFKNEYDNPFPAGPAQVFIENNFLGNINFPTLGINQGSFISLGTEQDIKVIRKEKNESKTGGLVKKGITLRFTIEIELISYKSEPVVIEVLDRIPISAQKNDITITDNDYNPKPHLVTDRNIVMWRETLIPKKKKTLTCTYSIKHPEDFRLTMQQGNHPYLGK